MARQLRTSNEDILLAKKTEILKFGEVEEVKLGQTSQRMTE